MNTPQTDTPHPQAPDFGEPWEPSYEMLFDRDGDYVGEFQPPFHNSSEVVARAIACVNALAGVSDPAEFVRQAREMREAIKEAHATLEDWELLWKEQAGLVSSRAFEDGRPVSKASIGARSKLQPFLKP